MKMVVLERLGEVKKMDVLFGTVAVTLPWQGKTLPTSTPTGPGCCGEDTHAYKYS